MHLSVHALDFSSKYLDSQPGKRHSGAPMLAPSEPHVRCRIRPAHDELIRVFENLWITIGGCVAQRDRLSWSDRLSVKMHVLSGRAGEASIWAVQSQELFHRRGNECFIVSKSLLQVFVHRQVMTY